MGQNNPHIYKYNPPVKKQKNYLIETKMSFFFFLSNTYNFSFPFLPSFFLPRQLSLSLSPLIFPSMTTFPFPLFYSKLGSNFFIRSLVAHSLSFPVENKFNFLPLFHLFFILGHENMKKKKCK